MSRLDQREAPNYFRQGVLHACSWANRHPRLLHSLGRLFNYNLFTTVVEFRITVLEDLLHLTVLLTDARRDTITIPVF